MPNEKDIGVEKALPLTTHLEELRKILIRVFAIVLVVFCFVYWKSYIFMDFITAPIIPIMPEKSSMAILKLTEGFFSQSLSSRLLLRYFFSVCRLYFISYGLLLLPGCTLRRKKICSLFCYYVVAPLLFFGCELRILCRFPFRFQILPRLCRGVCDSQPVYTMVSQFCYPAYYGFRLGFRDACICALLIQDGDYLG